MATNFYFQSGNTSGTTNEQRLLEDLIIESMKIYGHDVYYLPRRTIKQDDILGEDVLSRFENAYPIEMYLNNVDGWEGDGELFTKFSISSRDNSVCSEAKLFKKSLRSLYSTSMEFCNLETISLGTRSEALSHFTEIVLGHVKLLFLNTMSSS